MNQLDQAGSRAARAKRSAWSLRMACAVAGAAFLVGSASAADDFYSGRVLNMTIGYSVGGGYDMYARLLAKYLGSHLPGKPNVTPQNMPGAGSLKSINYLYSVAPKDGLTIGTFGRTMPAEPLLGDAKFDARKLTWLGSMDSDYSLCVTWKDSPIKTFDDMVHKPSRFGGQGAGSDPDVMASAIKNLFNAKVQLITGYPGSNETSLAMERGEIDGECGVSLSTLKIRHPDWLRDKKINLIVQVALEKSAELPDVPLLLDLAPDAQTRDIIKVIAASQTLSRPFAAPPGLPAERAAELRKAFSDTLQDPAFLDEAKKLGLDVHPVSYQKIDEVLADLYTLPADEIAKAKVAAGRKL
jgi:tripartite-type tricarboxylate transporter receptor subunit TctC